MIKEIYHFYDGPKLFSCNNVAGQIYIVLWLGDEEKKEAWLYVPVSETRYKQIRAGKISLRDMCLNPEDGLLFKIETDNIGIKIYSFEALPPSNLTENDLPMPDAYLKIKTNTLPELQESIMDRLRRTRCEIIDLALDSPEQYTNEISAYILGSSLVNVQELLNSIVYSRAGYKARTGRVPPNLKNTAELYAVGVFPSSFGMRLESKIQADMFDYSSLQDAIGVLINLINLNDDEEGLFNVFSELGGRVAARYSLFLSNLVSTATNIKTFWASQKDKLIKESHITWKEAQKTIGILSKVLEEIKEEIKINCRLDGIDVYSKTFDLVNLETNDRIKGNIDDSYFSQLMEPKVPGDYQATLLLYQEIIQATGEMKDKYLLKNLEIQ